MYVLRIASVGAISAALVAASWGTSNTSAGEAIVPIAALATTAAAPIAALAPVASAAKMPVTASVAAAAVASAPAVGPIATSVRPAWPFPAADVSRLVLIGDSLALETSESINFLTAPKEFVPRFFGGTAPCDWVDDDIHATSDTVVVISFTGNSLTPCMSDGAGGFLDHEAFAAAYRGDLEVLISRARRAGARVVLVGQPERAAHFNHHERVTAINAMLQEFAAQWEFVSFVDAGAAVETTDGQFAERLACNEFDIDCADGTSSVRGDGVHFCPVAGAFPCPVYSSGALRFAMAISNAANNPADFD